MNGDFLSFLARWALLHELADEGWKATVERGATRGSEGMTGGPDAFVDGLAALVAEEKDRLKDIMASGERPAGPGGAVDAAALDEIRFELGELRSRLEGLQVSVDALLARLERDG